MGLSTKQVHNSNEGLDWGQALLDSGPKLPAARRQPPQQLPDPVACPRCGSTNTKFCYYNNYNKSQPRHFCRACKRHWTKGGTLRNVPLGGGRKNKRVKTTAAATTTTAITAATTSQSQSLVGDQKDITQFPFHDFINNSCNFSVKGLSGNNGNFVGSNTLPPFTFSSLGSFERYPASSISSSFGSLDDYNFLGGLASNNNIIASQPLWQVPTTSGVMEVPSYWNNWDEMESLVSSEINIPWDDCEIKT